MHSSRWPLFLTCFLGLACGTVRENVTRCPNWQAAVERARAIAGCDANLRGDPRSRCQAALRKCKGGCDICQFLGGEDELVVLVADKDEWAPIRRVPIGPDNLNGYDGFRALKVMGLLNVRYKFNWHLCNTEGFVDVLADTILHESTHECASINPPGILDKKFRPQRGCSAEELENQCVGR